MALRKLSSLVFFRVSLCLTFVALSILVLLGLVALQSEGSLNVVAQVFSATKDSATLHEFSQLNSVVPMEEGDVDKIDEMLARYYLTLRYEQVPDTHEMVYRWGRGGPLYLLSTPSVYNGFAGNLEKKIGALPNIVSSIEIKQIKRQDNIFRINFRIYENLPDNQIRLKEKNVVLEFRYLPQRRRFSPIFTNPFGLVFTRVEETDVKSSQN